MILEADTYLQQRSRKSKDIAQTFITYLLILISRQLKCCKEYKKSSYQEATERQLVSSLKLIEQYSFNYSEIQDMITLRLFEDQVELDTCSEIVQSTLLRAVDNLEFSIKTHSFKLNHYKKPSIQYLKRIKFNTLGDYVKVIVVNPLLPPPWRPKTLPTLKNKTGKFHKKAGTL